MKLVVLFIAATVVLVSSVDLAGAVPSYTFTYINAPGAAHTWVNGINDAGQIVGTIPSVGGGGFVYQSSDDHFTSLNFGAQGINNAGDIVGYGYDTMGSASAGILLRADGSVYTNDMATAAWESGEGTLYVRFDDINDAGQIAGTMFNGGYPSGFILTGEDPTWYSGWGGRTGNFAPVRFSGQPEITGINNAGHLVAQLDWSCSCGGLNALWYDGTVHTLAAPEGAGSSIVRDINDLGQIVGAYSLSPWANGDEWGYGWHGLIWTGDTFEILDVPGAVSTQITGLNNIGQLVGRYWLSDGITRGFLATPSDVAQVPEPASWLLLGSGLIGFIAVRARAW